MRVTTFPCIHFLVTMRDERFASNSPIFSVRITYLEWKKKETTEEQKCFCTSRIRSRLEKFLILQLAITIIYPHFHFLLII